MNKENKVEIVQGDVSYINTEGEETKTKTNLNWFEKCKTECDNSEYLDKDRCISMCVAGYATRYKNNKQPTKKSLLLEDEIKNPDFMEEIYEIVGLLQKVDYTDNLNVVIDQLSKIKYESKEGNKDVFFIFITNVLEKLINQYNTTRSFGIGKYLWGKKKLHKRINQLFEDVKKNNPNMYTQDENEYVKKLIRDVKGGKTRKLKKYKNISKRNRNTRKKNISKRRNTRNRNISKRRNTRNRNISKRKNNF